MKRRRNSRRRSYRRNSVTTDDMLYLGVGAIAVFGLGMIIGKKQGQASVATAGLGAYYQNRMNIPISGLGGYVQVR